MYFDWYDHSFVDLFPLQCTLLFCEVEPRNANDTTWKVKHCRHFPRSGTKTCRQRAVIICRRASVSTRREVEISLDGSAAHSGCTLRFRLSLHTAHAPGCGLSSRSDKRMSTCFECEAHLTTAPTADVISAQSLRVNKNDRKLDVRLLW